MYVFAKRVVVEICLLTSKFLQILGLWTSSRELKVLHFPKWGVWPRCLFLRCHRDMEESVIVLEEKVLNVELNTDELMGYRTEYGCNSTTQDCLGSVCQFIFL